MPQNHLQVPSPPRRGAPARAGARRLRPGPPTRTRSRAWAWARARGRVSARHLALMGACPGTETRPHGDPLRKAAAPPPSPHPLRPARGEGGAGPIHQGGGRGRSSASPAAGKQRADTSHPDRQPTRPHSTPSFCLWGREFGNVITCQEHCASLSPRYKSQLKTRSR